MSKSQREKKERRKNRTWAKGLAENADRLQREGQAPAEFIDALRKAADLGKNLGTISGKKKLRSSQPT